MSKAEPVQVVMVFLERVNAQLDGAIDSAYLTGSAVYGDFHPGYSDIDFYFTAKRALTQDDFARAHALYAEYRALRDGYFSALEGEIVGSEGRTIYWGTSGDRLREKSAISGFSLRALKERGVLLQGRDIHEELAEPAWDTIRAESVHMLETVRQYALDPESGAHYADWLFLLSQTIYTLTTGEVTGKTLAARWMREKTENATIRAALKTAEDIRFAPQKYTVEMGKTLTIPIQMLADELQRKLK